MDDNPTESSPLLPVSRTSSPAATSPAAAARTSAIGPPLDINPQPPQPQQPQRQPWSSAAAGPNGTKSWPAPAGLPPRTNNDENLIIFRRAVGINYDLSSSSDTTTSTIEEGRHKRQHAVGMYRAVLAARRSKSLQFRAMWCLVLFCHFAQILIGASLTALGPLANDSQHGTVITVLGALNTVIAGVLALVSGQGVPDRIQKDEIGYRKVRDWIEETEALLSVGVLGRDRKEVGLLVEEAFKKYNAAKANEENNRPNEYVSSWEEPAGAAAAGAAAPADGSVGAAAVPWNR